MYEIANYGVVHALFIVILLLSRKTKPIHEKILTGWFVFLALPLLSRIFEPDMLDVPIHFFQLHLMFPITYGPFLWLYIKALTSQTNRFNRQDLFHFVPFLLLTAYQLVFDRTFNALERMEVDFVSGFDYVIVMINLTSMTYYSVISVLRLKRHGKEVLNHFSELPSRVTLKWLYWISAWFIFTYLVSSIASLFSLHWLLLSPSFALTLFVFSLSFFSLQQTSIFKPINDSVIRKPRSAENKATELTEREKHQLPPIGAEINQNVKYERSGLTAELSLYYLKKLEDYIESEKPYLDANLTIEKLSKQIAISRHHLTQIISEQLNKNFYLFINEYRIKTVKQYIDDAENHSFAMLDIAYMSGFNSKSTFNVVFKKLTGMTPSQYKKQKS